ncbi:tyrosine-type recombinase/integrase [Chitinimonas sp. PSY-7]|uniref:tyrosine-type recombinase/integrase n=1 Tax=Chitinimonas sp. PSY-7 TaxID=3459088 RepID=UPI00403FCAC9
MQKNSAGNWSAFEVGVSTVVRTGHTGIPGFSEKGRDIYVENVIYQAVLAVADQPLKDTLELAYLTGQRPSSVLSMAETDIRDGVLYVRQSKTGKKLRIAVKGKLAALLGCIKARKGDNKLRVLKLIVNEELRPLTTSALRSRFDKARIIAAEANPELATEIAEFQIRDLRAKAGTDVVEKSQGNMRKAQKQLGHANLAMPNTTFETA